MKTDSEIRAEGMAALVAALGADEAERFVASLSRERFDGNQRGQRRLPLHRLRLQNCPCRTGPPHQTRVQHTELRCLPMRRGGRHLKPLLVVGQFDGLLKTKFSWITQARQLVGGAINRGD